MEKKIISIGSNCEVSYQIEKYSGNLYSSLFSWAFTINDDDFLFALNNIDDIFENKIHFHLPSDNMFFDEKYNLTFHGRTPKEQIVSENGAIINKELYEETVEELKSRLNHLKDKFKNDLLSNDEKVYIRKILIEPSIESYGGIEKLSNFIEKLYAYFEEATNKGNYKLIIVLSKEDKVETIKKLERDKLFIRFVDYWAPFYDTKDGADYDSWKQIFDEFI